MDNYSINERIAEIISVLRVNKKVFAQAIGVSEGRLSNILTHRNRPDSQFLILLLNKYTNINSDYLMRGEMPIIRNKYGHLNNDNNGHLTIKEHQLNYIANCPLCDEKNKVIEHLRLSYNETLSMLHETVKDKNYYKRKLDDMDNNGKKTKQCG